MKATKKAKKLIIKNGVYFSDKLGVIIEVIGNTIFDGEEAYILLPTQITAIYGTLTKLK